MFLLPPSASPDILGEVQSSRNAKGTHRTQNLTFVSASIEDGEAGSAPHSEDDGDTIVLEDVFLAASENGCVVSRSTGGGHERPWKCSVPGGMVGLQWAT